MFCNWGWVSVVISVCGNEFGVGVGIYWVGWVGWDYIRVNLVVEDE